MFTFDSKIDIKQFLLDNFFKRQTMSRERQVRFAKLKLVRKAKIY